MKKIFYTLLALLIFSMPSISQTASGDTCRSEFEWKVNYDIMLFAPGMAVNFYDQSGGDVESWLWDFGDGTFSEEQNPMHIWTFLYGTTSSVNDAGVFIPRVCLTIKTKDGCSSTICKTLELTSDTVIFPGSGCYVYFYPYRNDSLISIPELIPYSFKVSAPENTVSYLWDFGDGSTSADANPTHGFDFMGSVYNVCLTIATADGCTNSFCTTVYIGYGDSTNVPGCQASYTYSVMESYPEQYAFQDLSIGNTSGWFWDFGDGSYSNEQNPVHTFWKLRDSLDASGYLGPPIANNYKVCLTVVNSDNCKSTYCDYVYMGGVIDTTIYPQPCPYFISVSTQNILGGNFCNGTASASLVDAVGNKVEASDFYWSTGETGSAANNLCVNSPYYVSITGVDGCQIVGSFSILDYTLPKVDPLGYWTINGNGYYYDLNYGYAVPDSGYECNWVFSDGTIMTGENVRYTTDGNFDKTVTLNVLDGSGNVVFSEEIALNQAVRVNETKISPAKLYPNPAIDDIHIQFNVGAKGSVQVEVYNSLGQKKISERFTDCSGSSEISLSVKSLGQGIYYARVLGIGSSPVTLSFVK
jgi:hypothetical protein